MPADRAEEARARMVEAFPQGFEERELGDELELAAYSEDPATRERLRDLGPVDVAVVRAGWEDEWRRFHRPVRIGPLWIGPSWEAAPDGAIVVLVDPGRAFGTGGHATTRLCLELLLTLERGSLVDVGCGSGVLAVAGAALGFAPVIGLDDDPVAIETTRANADRNGVLVDARQADVLVDPLPGADVAVVNIARAVVEAVAAQFEGRLLVASGYLEAETPAAPGWRVVDRRVRDGWAADLLERAGDGAA